MSEGSGGLKLDLHSSFDPCGGFDRNSIIAVVEMDISGLPVSAPGEYSFSFIVTDGDGKQQAHPVTWVVHSEPIVQVDEFVSLIVGESYDAADQLIGFLGGYGDLDVELASGSLPTGMQLENGSLVGSPTEAGTWTAGFVVTDETGRQDSFEYTFDVVSLCGEPVVFSTPGSFTYSPPEGCSYFVAEAWGGGANGAGADFMDVSGGAGGGGGAYVMSTVQITAASYNIVVGGAGQNSYVRLGGTDIVRAAGATGRNGGRANSSLGDVKTSGSAGDFGSSSKGGNGGRGGNNGGLGGQGGSGHGAAGAAPGGGGGGGGYGRNGGAGARGEVRITPHW